MITPEQEKAIAHQQLRDCVKQLGDRAVEIGETHVAGILYTVGGAIDHRNEHQLAEVCGTFALAMKDALAAKQSPTQS